MFFKLDEFNKHVNNCKGTQNNHYTTSTPIRSKNGGNNTTSFTAINSDSETYSATGRPMRHCVKEVGTYKDEPDIGPSEEKVTYEKGAHLK